MIEKHVNEADCHPKWGGVDKFFFLSTDDDAHPGDDQTMREGVGCQKSGEIHLPAEMALSHFFRHKQHFCLPQEKISYEYLIFGNFELHTPDSDLFN